MSSENEVTEDKSNYRRVPYITITLTKPGQRPLLFRTTQITTKNAEEFNDFFNRYMDSIKKDLQPGEELHAHVHSMVVDISKTEVADEDSIQNFIKVQNAALNHAQ